MVISALFVSRKTVGLSTTWNRFNWNISGGSGTASLMILSGTGSAKTSGGNTSLISVASKSSPGRKEEQVNELMATTRATNKAGVH